MVNSDQRAIFHKAHHLYRKSPPDSSLKSDSMFSQSTVDTNKSPEPPLIHTEAPLDSEHGKQPPPPDLTYKPYPKQLPLPGQPPYRPYTKKPGEPEPLYEPYKGI